MVNIEWKENGKTRYENLLSENSVDDFVKELENRCCEKIVVTKDIEIVVKECINSFNKIL